MRGADRAHALSHLLPALVALAVVWAVMRLWRPPDGRFERWSRLGLIGALGIATATWAVEAICALGWAADGSTERWPALTAAHDDAVVFISAASLLLVFAAALLAAVTVLVVRVSRRSR